ncbi:LysM peptidoglycan-binding domain-containing protein [Tenacibaculum sp. TC6]|uniref:LysM peptidoglycan-binding domain-containing protein n=1 Tax=Tenacibaculum sp. TC6 TaxID=3423223 RepID=UPI003D363934
MRKMILLCFLLVGTTLVAQEKKLPKGWDVILLNGETAYMNLVTGEVSKKYPNKPAQEKIEETDFDPTIIHIVKKGETLSTIARSYVMPLSRLYQLNSLTDFDDLEVGQEIVVGYATTEKAKNDFLKGIPSEKVIDAKYHTVKKGDTLFTIAKHYGITVNELKRKNMLNDTTIYLGQRLIIN